MSLPECTLCTNTSDPQMNIQLRDGRRFVLCDGCAPSFDDADIQRVAELCRASNKPHAVTTNSFGFNEPDEDEL